jgi:crotonobetainyl-CoA:carnitine CoA-transferase CaiB-like acyl-CoA transferase
LHGTRIIDASTTRAELAGRILADLGAEVIKIEPPGGAAARRMPPFERGREGDVEGSLYWAAVGLGKRSVVLDVENESDREHLRELLAHADVFIESFDPGTLESLGLGYDAVRELNPALVYVSVTPFGQDGPQAKTPATELTLEAAGGLLGLQGDRDRPPVPVGYPQAAFHAGAQAAADALVALYESRQSGLGQHLDVSMQSAIVWTLMNATGYPPNTGGNPPSTSEFRADGPPEILPGLPLPTRVRFADGLGFVGLGLPGVGWRTLHAMMRWAEQKGSIPPDLCGIDWQNWVDEVLQGTLPQERVVAALEALLAFLQTQPKAEVLALAIESRLLLAPVNSIADIRNDPQLAARNYWTQVGDRIHPGPFAKLSLTPVRLGSSAPELGEGQPLLGTPRGPSNRLRTKTRPASNGVFAGLKVADFAWVGVGPLITKALADHGATVVHVESSTRLDVLRQLPPFKDSEPGADRAQFMANFNSSKLGLGIDLANEAGQDLARRLAGWADVVVESFTPGNMKKFGLDWEALSRGRSDLVMVSTCLRGQTGPEASYGGFGNQGAAIGGFIGITGWPDREPCGPWGAYTDFIAPRYGLAAITAALLHRANTGEGQFIDLAQIEAAIHFLEPLTLDYTANGRTAGPVGHDSPTACPHRVYQTAGAERYVAIAVETAEQWSALCSAGLGSFESKGLASLSARLTRREEIDAALRDWCRDQEPFDLARRLQAAGVPASVVMRPTDLYEDAQLAHRDFFVTLDHTQMGPTPYDGPVTHFSRTPARLRRAAPCLGEHTEQVLRDFLGLEEDEITEYAIAGALT